MGGKIRFGKISALGILAFQSLMGLAGTTLPEISIRSDYHLEDEPLTTDLIGKLDPAQINPQRMNWLLTRMTQISGLEVTKKDDGRYGVRVQGLLVTTRGYLRPDGIRFKRIEEFRCGADTHFGADPVFSTFEGNKNTLLFANDEWLRLLDEKRTLLAVTLAHLGHATEAGARDLGQRVFNRWLAGVEQDWRFKSIPMARAKEWKEYTQEASQKKICPRSVKKKLSEDVSKIESLSELEPLVGEPPKVTQILARVPARLWNGYFSVRMDIVLGDRALNGRFLIDPGAPQSVISPVWLENQGVYTAWVSAPDLKPSRVRWAIPPKDQTGALANFLTLTFMRPLNS
ncbi:MAG: hypothetical protein HYX41_00385 [Bdellovibrio sp.]|nr:hypothetical protein [Bdellovibrio sp.]